MIPANQIKIIKSTIPILETGGETLTKHFYGLLMKNDTVRPLFNQTHQKSGAQPRALANSILCYARHIDQLAKMGPLATQIVHKHVAFQIMPEHYPIVGACLLRSIREVLGEETATDEVLQAWGAAYQQLADILIAAEAKLYDEIAAAPGGWRDARKFTVTNKTAANAAGDIVTFELTPSDKGAVIIAQPGQYLTFVATIPGQPDSLRRNYSISQSPTNGKSFTISVKRLPQGIFSGWMHDTVKVGDELDVFAPAGEFVLPPEATAAEAPADRPLVLVSAGVGITPTIAMLEAATATGAPARPISFVHYTQSADSHAFAQHVDAIAANNKNVNVFTSYTGAAATGGARTPTTTGRITAEHVASVLKQAGGAANADVYVLGPKGFMKSAKDYFLEAGVPADNVKWEFFSPSENI
jgi:nitric oxide dioxygenase